MKIHLLYRLTLSKKRNKKQALDDCHVKIEAFLCAYQLQCSNLSRGCPIICLVMLKCLLMSGQIQPQKRFDKGSHNTQKVTYTTNKKVVKLDTSSQDSDQSFYPHSRSRHKLKKSNRQVKPSETDKQQTSCKEKSKTNNEHSQNAKLSKKNKKSKRKRRPNSEKSSSYSESQQYSISSLSSRLSNNTQPTLPPKAKEIQRSRYSYPISKPSEVLIQKPQINDPELDKAMEQILFKIATQIKPKNKKKYAYDQPPVYDPSLHNRAFSKEAFSFKEDQQVKVKQEYLNNPYMPPSLRNSNGQKIVSNIGSEYDMSLQQLPLKGTVLKSKGKTEQKAEAQCINDTSDQQVEIVQSNQQKKSKQLQLINWIQRVNNSHKLEKNDQSTTAASRPEVLFDKHGIQQFLYGLDFQS